MIKKLIKISEFIVFGSVIFFVGLMTFSILLAFHNDEKLSDFCEDKFPVEGVYYDTIGLEEGYTDCCGYVLIEHRYEKKCYLFKYEGEIK